MVSLYFFLGVFTFFCNFTVGSNSATCPNGRDGRDGITVIGPAGRDGRDGKDGQDCVECAKGPMGPKGKNGTSGMNGLPGKEGIQGKVGPQGMKGDKGDSGVIGAKGDKGVCDSKVLNKMQTDVLSFQKEFTALKQKVATLEKENQYLKNVLDGNNKIKQSYLPAGYDKYSLYDIQWQSLHMAAAAACRGSVLNGGSGPHVNYVYPRKRGVSCTTICLQSTRKRTICDAEVSIYGNVKKSTNHKLRVSAFYNYGCDTVHTWGDEVYIGDTTITSNMNVVSFCCCRAEK